MLSSELIAPGIVVYRNPVSDIRSIFDFVDQYELWGVGQAAKSRFKKPNLENYRDVSAFNFVVNEEDYDYDTTTEHGGQYISSLRLIKQAIDPCIDAYIEKYSIDVLENETTMYQVLRYVEGQRFSEHNDDAPEHRRAISAVYYANDDYSGGELYFNQFDLLYKPKAGDCIVFPAMWVYSHVAREVTDGDKLAIVSFRK